MAIARLKLKRRTKNMDILLRKSKRMVQAVQKKMLSNKTGSLRLNKDAGTGNWNKHVQRSITPIIRYNCVAKSFLLVCQKYLSERLFPTIPESPASRIRVPSVISHPSSGEVENSENISTWELRSSVPGIVFSSFLRC